MTPTKPQIRFGAGTPGEQAEAPDGGPIVATIDSVADLRMVEWSIAATDDAGDVAAYTIVTSGAYNEIATISATVDYDSNAFEAGSAAVLKAIVNAGIDPQLGPSAFMTTTAKFFVPTATTLEVAVTNEQFETNQKSGWSKLLNAAIRAFDGVVAGVASVAATASTIVKRDGAGGIFASALQTIGLTTPVDQDLLVTPGDYASQAGAKRHYIQEIGSGNTTHGGQSGAFVFKSAADGAVCDWHGVAPDYAGGDLHIKRWFFGFGGPHGNGYPYAVSVDVSFEGAYSFNLAAYATAALAVNIQAANTFGFLIQDATNSRLAFQVTSLGTALNSTVDTGQTGSMQWATIAQAGTPAASRIWVWSDGTVLRGKNHAGDSIITLRVDAATGNTVIDTGASVASTGKKVSYFVDGASFIDVYLASGNAALSTAGTLATFAQTMTTVVSGGYWRVQSPGIYLDGPLTQIRDASANIIVDVTVAAGNGVKVNRAVHTPRQVLTVSSGTLTVDMSLSNHVQITYSGSFTLAFSNLKDGAHYAIHLINNVGAATLSYPSSIKVPGGSIAQPSQTSGKHDTIIGVCDGTNIYGELKLAYA